MESVKADSKDGVIGRTEIAWAKVTNTIETLRKWHLERMSLP